MNSISAFALVYHAVIYTEMQRSKSQLNTFVVMYLDPFLQLLLLNPGKTVVK